MFKVLAYCSTYLLSAKQFPGYNPCFEPFEVATVSQEIANLLLAVLFDAVLRVATRLSAPVIDLRRVMTQAGKQGVLRNRMNGRFLKRG